MIIFVMLLYVDRTSYRIEGGLVF